MKKTRNPITLSMMNPLNRDQEKKKFFFDALYNPQFTYERPIRQEDRDKYGKVSDTYLPQAKHILDTVIKTWGNESTFLLEVEGKILTREQSTESTRKYLEENGIENMITLRYSSRAVSPASINANILTFRLPVNHREKKFLGVLHHEVGTHFFRSMNDERQPWRKQREKYSLSPYYDTEEGLAVLHSHMTVEKPLLWFAALYYYLVYCAERMTFSELYQEAKKYVDNDDRRWNMCVRVKRGISDTSIPGAFSKDQVYLRGVIKMLDWLDKHHYDPRPLYVGKIAVKDLHKARVLKNPTWTVRLPAFLENFGDDYVAAIKKIRKENKL